MPDGLSKELFSVPDGLSKELFSVLDGLSKELVCVCESPGSARTWQFCDMYFCPDVICCVLFLDIFSLDLRCVWFLYHGMCTEYNQ